MVYGAVYSLTHTEVGVLDEVEGRGRGYEKRHVRWETDGRDLIGFTYEAMDDWINDDLHPFVWYKELVISGLRYHDFDLEYIQIVESVNANFDVDPVRQKEMRHLLAAMLEHQSPDSEKALGILEGQLLSEKS